MRRGCSLLCTGLLRCLAARDLTLRDAFALLVPMRTLSYALRQWFASKSYLQRLLQTAS